VIGNLGRWVFRVMLDINKLTISGIDWMPRVDEANLQDYGHNWRWIQISNWARARISECTHNFSTNGLPSMISVALLPDQFVSQVHVIRQDAATWLAALPLHGESMPRYATDTDSV
jgi:hypothetical protein